MIFNYLRAHNTVISRTKRDFGVKEKTFFFASQVLSFRHTKQTEQKCCGRNLYGMVSKQISKWVFQENKARQIFRKTNISYPLIRTHTLFVFREIWRAVFF